MSDALDTPSGGDARAEAGAGGLLRRLWVGEVPLAQVFWNYAMIGGSAFNVAATLAAMALLASDAPDVAAIVAFALPIPYNLLMVVAVWQSARAYTGARLWADLARLAIIIWTIATTLT
jgi:hypothetical protein